MEKLTLLGGVKTDLNLFEKGKFSDVSYSYFYGRILLLSFHSSRLVFCAYNNRYQTIFNFKAHMRN